MKKIYKIALFILPIVIPVTSLFAADVGIKLVSPIQAKSTAEVLKAFFDILVQIGAVAVTLAVVYAGFLFVAAQGNPEKLNQARKTLFYTIIGALVLLGAQVIAGVIESTIKELQ
jgi:heme/copper-type cytochrome/quinol oxidase subunit 2